MVMKPKTGSLIICLFFIKVAEINKNTDLNIKSVFKGIKYLSLLFYHA